MTQTIFVPEIVNMPAVYTSIDRDGMTLASVFLIDWAFEMFDSGDLVEVIEVRDLHVKPSERGNGFLRSLMDYSLNNYADRPIMLRVESFDHGMPTSDLIAWYQRLGFEFDCPFMDGDDWLWRRPVGEASNL